MGNKRYLIINADDFGLNKSVNGAVSELFQLGAITSATILAPAALSEEACRISAEAGLAVGVHWTLNSEWADEKWRPCAGDSVPSLLKEGFLMHNDKEMAGAAGSADVTRELEAQYLSLLGRGCRPDHADSHGGTLYGTNGRLFFLNAFSVCRKYGLPFRFARQNAFISRQLGGRIPPALRIAHRTIVRLAGLMKVKLLDDLVTHPLPVEKIEGYEALCAYYEKELAGAGPGITEVFMHPALPDDALLKRTPQWQKRVWEYTYLKSGRFTRFIEGEGFIPVSWAQAPFGRRKP